MGSSIQSSVRRTIPHKSRKTDRIQLWTEGPHTGTINQLKLSRFQCGTTAIKALSAENLELSTVPSFMSGIDWSDIALDRLAAARHSAFPVHWNSLFSLHFHLHLTFHREGRRGTTDDLTTSFLHFSLFSTTIWDLANARRVHSLMLSFHLYPLFLSPLQEKLRVQSVLWTAIKTFTCDLMA